MRQYLKVDFYRAVTSKAMLMAVMGVFCVYLAGWIQVSYCRDVFEIFYYIKMYSIIVLVYAFSALAYANALVEDAEHKYWYLLLQRGSLLHYVWSKVISCFCMAVFTITAGTMLFAFAARLRLPFYAGEEAIAENIRVHDCFGALIEKDKILLYFCVTGIMMGLLGGILALFSMWLSLYVRNRMFALCIPVVGFYFWSTYFQRIFGDLMYVDLNAIYLGNSRTFSNGWLCFGYAVLIALVIGGGLGLMIRAKVRKELQGETK